MVLQIYVWYLSALRIDANHLNCGLLSTGDGRSKASANKHTNISSTVYYMLPLHQSHDNGILH